MSSKVTGEDAESDVNLGCLLYKEGRPLEACHKFQSSQQILGVNPHLSYNIALCYYAMKQYAQALR